MTYTLATMEVSKETYQEILGRLGEAGYGHAIHEDGTLDMTHIGLVKKNEDVVANRAHDDMRMKFSKGD